jgi:2-haloacid dehalogenase
MMVACHVSDLQAAAARGLRTAFVLRPDEYGTGRGGPLPSVGEFDFEARDFIDLANQLGA